MISFKTAKALKEAGLEWNAQIGDWFANDLGASIVISPSQEGSVLRRYYFWIPHFDQLLEEGVKRGYWIAIVPYPTKTKVIWEALLYTWWNGDFCELTEKEFMEGDKSNVPLFVHDFPEEAAAQALLWILRKGGITDV